MVAQTGFFGKMRFLNKSASASLGLVRTMFVGAKPSFLDEKRSFSKQIFYQNLKIFIKIICFYSVLKPFGRAQQIHWGGGLNYQFLKMLKKLTSYLKKNRIICTDM